MIFAKVVGTVVATQKDEKLEGIKFLIVQPTDLQGNIVSDDYKVCADTVGAGIGEIVMFVTGSSARQTKLTEGKPVDATIMAIVDIIEKDGKVTFKKVK